MADVFISYSKPERNLTKALAEDLQARGYTVWWDTDLLSGRHFEREISAQLDDCRNAIIIWTPRSIRSDWVYSEASHAHRDGKLIAVLANNLDPLRIPKPFDGFTAVPIEDRGRIITALRGKPSGKPVSGDKAFFDKHVLLLGTLASNLYVLTTADIGDEAHYTARLLTAAALLDEAADDFLAGLPLRSLSFDDRLVVTKLEAEIPEVKGVIAKERSWLTKRYSSSVLRGARNDLGWAAERIAGACEENPPDEIFS